MFEPLIEGVRFLESNRTFLGREFLTWLWFMIDTHDQEVCSEFKLFVDNKIKMVSAGGSSHNVAITGGTPSCSKEATQALNAGKTVTEAAFVLVHNDREYSFVLKCETILPQNVKLPEMKQGLIDTPEDLLNLRLQEYEELCARIQSLFFTFMKVRTNQRQFSTLLVEMEEWIKSKNC